MYARDLMIWLHERVARMEPFEHTQKRFESLRAYGLLPRGRENASARLSYEQIASAILGFAHPLFGFAGHASLILGDLKPVGGLNASFRKQPNLLGVVAELIKGGDECRELLRLTLSVENSFNGDEYTASVYFRDPCKPRKISFVSKYASGLQAPGAEREFDHEKLDSLTAIQRSFGARFFRQLEDDNSIARQMDLPIKTDWTEYESEEEKSAFHKKLGALPSSRFLNLRVDAQVRWPNEPTRLNFGGHNLVLFPMTHQNSHSISIDLMYEKISVEDARSLINRLLSVMSWCDDRPASLHEGWSGNPVPVPIPKRNLAFSTMREWHFYRSLPNDEGLKTCLAYYRDGLNAISSGLVSHAVVSFFRVFETKYHNKEKVRKWVEVVFQNAVAKLSEQTLKLFERDRHQVGADLGTYVYTNCRVATAHAARDVPSDPDAATEFQRLFNAAKVIQRLARYFIEEEYKYSNSYNTD